MRDRVFVCLAFRRGIRPILSILAQGGSCFEQANCDLSDGFLCFCEKHGGHRIFGYPLARDLVENTRPRQRRQLVRTGLPASVPSSHPAQLIVLGEGLADPVLPTPRSKTSLVKYPDSGNLNRTGCAAVRAFLQFLGANRGLEALGDPNAEQG